MSLSILIVLATFLLHNRILLISIIYASNFITFVWIDHYDFFFNQSPNTSILIILYVSFKPSVNEMIFFYCKFYHFENQIWIEINSKIQWGFFKKDMKKCIKDFMSKKKKKKKKKKKNGKRKKILAKDNYYLIL